MHPSVVAPADDRAPMHEDRPAGDAALRPARPRLLECRPQKWNHGWLLSPIKCEGARQWAQPGASDLQAPRTGGDRWSWSGESAALTTQKLFSPRRPIGYEVLLPGGRPDRRGENGAGWRGEQMGIGRVRPEGGWFWGSSIDRLRTDGVGDGTAHSSNDCLAGSPSTALIGFTGFRSPSCSNTGRDGVGPFGSLRPNVVGRDLGKRDCKNPLARVISP